MQLLDRESKPRQKGQSWSQDERPRAQGWVLHPREVAPREVQTPAQPSPPLLYRLEGLPHHWWEENSLHVQPLWLQGHL